MDKHTAIDTLLSHEVIILGYNHQNNGLQRFKVIVRNLKKYLPNLISDCKDKIIYDGEKLTFEHSSLQLDTTGIIFLVDDHFKNIIYIKARDYALALYILMGKNEIRQ